MININKLEFEDNNTLVIDFSVKEDSYYNDVYIDSVTIDTNDTFVSDTSPSENPIYNIIYQNETKRESLRITSKHTGNKSLDDKLLFIFIKTRGIPDSETPCGKDNIYTLGIIYYDIDILKTSFVYLKELDNTCCIPKNFIDFILRKEALDNAIKVKDSTTALKFYKDFFTNTNYNNINTGCKCYGRVNE